MADYKPIQILTPHAPDCHHREATDLLHVWVLPEHVGYGTIQRDLTGRRNVKAHHDWLKFRCNNPECPGELIVYLVAMVGWIKTEIRWHGL